jgi:glycosyltransferase involved in cell wall biosynthesis
MRATRVTFCLTHPVQYFAPWFRYIAARRPELDLTVIYASRPTADQQGAGFDEAFTWDTALTAGYRHLVLEPSRAGQRFDSGALFGVDAPGVGSAIRDSMPDVVVVPGWHSAFYLRATRACRQADIPVLYRGDTHLASAGAWWRRPFWRMNTRAMLRRFDAYMAVGTRAHEYLSHFGIPDPRIVRSPHAVDNGMFAAQAAGVTGDARRQARSALGLDPDSFVVAFAGKFQANKRPDTVLRAAHRAEAPVNVLMIGSGALLEDCRTLGARLGVRTAWMGLVNQSRMAAAIALADCVVLPSEHESWGLVVNEALACGVPCAVTETAGCAPDLIAPGETGETFRPGDVDGLAAALNRIHARQASGHDFASACRARAAGHSYEKAADGLAAACRRVLHPRALERRGNPGHPRVLAGFGGMVLPSGVERMSFEVLRVLRDRGAAAHCIVNRWASSRIVDLAEQIGAGWSTGYYWYSFDRHTRNPIRWMQLAWDIACTSAGLLRDAWRFGPTHVLMPEFGAVLRNAPALWILRRLGVPVILRLGNAPDQGSFYRALWRRAIDPVVDRYVSNSRFIESELLAHGIDARKSHVVHNAAPQRIAAGSMDAVRQDEARVIFVGQIIPQKGLDLLLDAIARLAALGYDVRLDVVGELDGWESPSYSGYRARIRERAAAPDLAGRVRLLGAREDVPVLLAASGLHCCPSRPEQREGFAVVNLEAKRAGIPSVVFPTGSLPEMVTHGIDGWICRDTSVEALVEGLAYFLADPARRRAAAAAARQSDRYYNRARFTAEWGEVFGIAAAPSSVSSEAIA